MAHPTHPWAIAAGADNTPDAGVYVDVDERTGRYGVQVEGLAADSPAEAIAIAIGALAFAHGIACTGGHDGDPEPARASRTAADGLLADDLASHVLH